jgi:hypothetical protein
MKFNFDVGDRERHHIDVSDSWFSGRMRLMVDGAVVLTSLRLFAFSEPIRRYEIIVGSEEQHKVELQIEWQLPFPGFRKKKYRAIVDGKLTEAREGF